MGERSPLVVRCRRPKSPRLQHIKCCSWTVVGELRVAQFRARNGDDFKILHQSTRRPGYWQVTRFLDDGTPAGHVEAPTAQEALDEGLGGCSAGSKYGWKLEHVVDGRGQRLAGGVK